MGNNQKRESSNKRFGCQSAMLGFSDGVQWEKKQLFLRQQLLEARKELQHFLSTTKGMKWSREE